ncbi:uncharacterized protein LOC108049552 isoform X2 [Drosophila rhopaloa]|uniref:Uncharacterized protein n=1 Tax=Drosophila rhopaloa TaxID=1041015 RepID=A0ABM5HW71_DRORH|nr:uncharacterized protein LOC108049552 isoform X2 [Drosophila rhopaloa]
MDKSNKYRNELRGHFYGSKNPSPLNENKDQGVRGHQDVESRSRYERNSPLHQARPDNYRDHIKCQCQDHRCSHGHRLYRTPDPLSRKHCHNDCQQPQQHQRSNPRIVNEPSPRYSPKPRNCKLPFTHTTRNRDPANEKGGGDCLLYKNLTFGGPPSSISEHGDGEVGEKKQATRCSHQHHKKESHNYLDAVQAHCQAVGDRFQRKFPFSSDESTSKESKSKPSQNTVISAKSGDDLRAAVRSQIEMQAELDEFALEVKDKRGDALSGGKNNAKSRKSRIPNPDLQSEEVVAVVVEPQLNIADPDDLQVADFSVSADDIVSAKVIDPMIRKIQRMYLNTLKEEMHLMEYLEKVPKLVSEVYKREAAEKEQRKH